MSNSFYRAFEDRYRGSRDVIKQRQRSYADFIGPLVASQQPATALDLGCGRGEWLELLGEYGFSARGIDLDDGMLEACRENGLNVENRDALSALRAQPDASLALVSAFHLIEHIPFEMVQDIITESLRALRPGGLLILETPNPENLVVGASSFYLDPSHLHPIPPGLLEFATEHGGFTRQRVLRLQEPPQLHGHAAIGLIDVLEGVSPDYSVVAQKAGPQVLMERFDSAFAAPRGIALGALAQRYETQRARQHAEIHQILGRSERHIEEGKITTDALNARLEMLNARMEALTLRTETLALRMEEGLKLADDRGRHIEALLDSTSWRVTAPLRMVSSWVLRVRAARAEGRLSGGMKRRMLYPLRRILQGVIRRPRLKRAALRVLRHFPGLQSRLLATLYAPDSVNWTLPPQPVTPGDLSPRAARIYLELKLALEAKKN